MLELKVSLHAGETATTYVATSSFLKVRYCATTCTAGSSDLRFSSQYLVYMQQVMLPIAVQDIFCLQQTYSSQSFSDIIPHPNLIRPIDLTGAFASTRQQSCRTQPRPLLTRLLTYCDRRARAVVLFMTGWVNSNIEIFRHP